MTAKNVSIRMKITSCFVALLCITIIIAYVNLHYLNKIINEDMHSIQCLGSLKMAHGNIALAERGLSIRLFSRALRQMQYEGIATEMKRIGELQRSIEKRFSSSKNGSVWESYCSKWRQWKPEDDTIVRASQKRDSLIKEGSMVEDQDITQIDGDVVIRIVSTDQIATECIAKLDTIITINNASIKKNVIRIKTITAIIITLGLVLAALIWFFLNSLVIKRLFSLSKKAEEIRTVNDFNAKMEERGNDEIHSLAHSINLMLETLAQSHKTIHAQNEQVKLIMNTVPAGLVVLDENNAILPNYSIMAEKILGKSPLTGSRYFDELGLSAAGEENQKKLFDFLDLLRMELLSDLELADLNPFPMYELKKPTSKKWIKLRYYLIKSDSAGKNHVLVVMEDVTEEKKLADKFSQSQRENLQLKAIAEDPELFREFLYETKKILAAITTQFSAIHSENKYGQAITEIFRGVHTIKGVAGSFGLIHLSEISGNCETILSEMRKDAMISPEKHAAVAPLLKNLESEFETVQKNAMKILGDDLHGKGSYVKISLEELKKHIYAIQNMQIDDMLKDRMITRIREETLFRFLSLKKIPLKKGLARAMKIVPSLVVKCGKKVEFTFLGEDTAIDCEIAAELNNPMIHLLRNAFDHGIETPEDRLSASKPEIGKVALSARDEENFIALSLADDGNGIDVQKVKTIGIARGLFQEKDPGKISDRECFDLLFLPGFSTAGKVTEISGRGVGLDVVQNVIKTKLHGTIGIESAAGKGTTFTIHIPKSI